MLRYKGRTILTLSVNLAITVVEMQLQQPQIKVTMQISVLSAISAQRKPESLTTVLKALMGTIPVGSFSVLDGGLILCRKYQRRTAGPGNLPSIRFTKKSLISERKSNLVDSMNYYCHLKRNFNFKGESTVNEFFSPNNSLQICGRVPELHRWLSLLSSRARLTCWTV